MAEYAFYLVEFTTGRVLGEVAVSPGASFTRSLNGAGDCSCAVRLDGKSVDERRALLELLEAGRVSVAVSRGGACAGEWLISAAPRNSADAGVSVSGVEIAAYLGVREVGTRSYYSTDQLEIAADLVRDAFAPGEPGGVEIEVPYAYSGRLRDRSYFESEAYALDRLAELAAVNDGFDWWIQSDFGTDDAGRMMVKRRFRTGYPRAGIDQRAVLELPGVGEVGGNVDTVNVPDDWGQLATHAACVGAGEGPTRVIGRASSGDLIARGWPRIDAIESRTTINQVATAEGYARARVDAGRASSLTPEIVVWADGEPEIGTFNLGDRFQLIVGDLPVFPGGWQTRVRVIGWTLTPPDAERERVSLVVVDADSAPEGEESEG